MHPINGKSSSTYNYSGYCHTEAQCRANPSRTVCNDVTFKLFIQGGVIRDARWEIFGDPVAIASASWCVQHVRGKEVHELVHVITPENIAMDLEISDELDIRAGCMAVIGALTEALDAFKQSPP